MTKAFLLLTTMALAEQPPAPFTFTTQKPACTLVDGKLILSKKWPLGSWEECAHSVLSAAQQLDALRDQAVKELQAEKIRCQITPPKK